MGSEQASSNDPPHQTNFNMKERGSQKIQDSNSPTTKNTPGSRGEGSGRGHKGGKDNNSVDHGDIISSIIDTKLNLYGK